MREDIAKRWQKEFWRMNKRRNDVAVVVRPTYFLVEYQGDMPILPGWFPTRLVQPPARSELAPSKGPER